MGRLVSAIDPLLDTCPVDLALFSQGSLLQRLKALRGLQVLFQAGKEEGDQTSADQAGFQSKNTKPGLFQ